MLSKMLELADTEDFIATLQEDYLIGPRKTTEDQSMALVKFVQFTGRSYERCVMIFKSFKITFIRRIVLLWIMDVVVASEMWYRMSTKCYMSRNELTSFSCSQSIFFDTILSHTNNI